MTALTGSTSNSRPRPQRSGEVVAAKAAARRAGRRARRALSAALRAEMDRAICRHIESLGVYRRARAVAMYLDFDGEPSLLRLPTRAYGRAKSFYAPVLRAGSMEFRSLDPGEAWRENAFGIREPLTRERVDPRRLDLVLTPLVAFDRSGTRIGMGAGYYDRCFAFLRGRRLWRKPKLLGVAYSVQHVTALPRDGWDVPLWGVVTELGVELCRSD